MKIFFSYPHGDNAPLIERIKGDLEARGHEIWFDADRIKTGDDWRNAITRGILDSQQVVAFLSKHSVRDPGVCLNEIAIALADKGEAMVTVLVEPEAEVNIPVSITHIQWLRMEDWEKRIEEDGWYEVRRDRLIEAIEHPGQAVRNEELETLRKALQPMSFHADIARHIPAFTGRRWIIDRYERWLAEEAQSRVLRIEGGPGLGKTAVVSYLAHSTRSSVLGIHLCQFNNGDSRNPQCLVQTLAYQLATRLPDYRAILLRRLAERSQDADASKSKDALSLWSELISEPLCGLIGRQRLAIIVDGLDEATVESKNPIVELLADGIKVLPNWIGVVLTGRPDPELTRRLAGFAPLVLNDTDEQNLTDLKVYVDAWMELEVRNGRLTGDQGRTAGEALLARSEGAFLYLAQARAALAEGAFDLTRPGDLPAGLGGIYLGFFERRFPDAKEKNSDFRTAVRPLLALILASPEPLPVPLAAEILGWDAYDGDEIIDSLGSLLRHGRLGVEPTLTPFHASVKDWLTDARAAGPFRVATQPACVPLTETTWKRYLAAKETDDFAWQVLPDLLSLLSTAEQERLLGDPTWEISQVLFRLADSLAPKLRLSEAAAAWNVQIAFSEKLVAANPEDTEFARDLSISYHNLGRIEQTLGNTSVALERHHQGASIAEHLVVTAPKNDNFACDLSIAYSLLGDTEVALGNINAALGHYKEALAISERLAAAFPDNARYALQVSISFNNLGEMECEVGNSEAALRCFRQALVFAKKLAVGSPVKSEYAIRLSSCYDMLGDMERTLGNTNAALGHYKESLVITERLAVGTPENASYALGFSYVRMGIIERALGNTEAAMAWHHQSMAIRERLSAAAPESAEFAHDLNNSYRLLGKLEQAQGNTNAALKRYWQAVAIAERLVATSPENAKFVRDLSISYGMLGDMEWALGNCDAALERYRQAMTLAERLAANAPESAEYALDLSISYGKLGQLERALGNTETALAWYLQSIAILERLFSAAPESTMVADYLSFRYNEQGEIERALGNTEGALAWYHQSMAIRERLFAAAPESAEFAHDLNNIYRLLGKLEQEQGNTNAALKRYWQAVTIAERLVATTPENAQFVRDLSISYGMLGDMEWALGNCDAALERYRQTMTLAERLAANAPESAEYALDLSVSYSKLGQLEQALGNTEIALAWYLRSMAIHECLFAAAPKNVEYASYLGRSMAAVTRIHGEYGEFSDMQACVARALGIAEAESHLPLLGWLHDLAGWASTWLGDFSSARKHFEHALAQAREAGNAIGLAWRQASLANVDWLEGRDDTAATLGELALLGAHTSKDSDLLTNALLVVGRAHHALGDTAQAGDAYAEALELEVRDEVAECAFLLGLVRREQGRTGESDALFERVRTDCADQLSKAPKLYAPRYLQALERLARGQTEEGLGALTQAIHACAAAGVIRRNLRVLDLVGRATTDSSGIARAREMLEAADKASG